MTALLSIEGLGGGYRSLSVFRDVSFAVRAGEIFGILGPNGAGKTTLMKTIAGLLPTQSGAVRLESVDMQKAPAHARARAGLALSPEGRQILAAMSVRDNLELSKSAGRLAGPAFETALEETLSLFPRLRDRLDQAGGSLSGGEQQMLAISRALLLKPRVLLLDEPTQGLAPIMNQQVLAAIQALRGRIAMVIVEQNRDFLASIADQTFIMEGGRLTVAADSKEPTL